MVFQCGFLFSISVFIFLRLGKETLGDKKDIGILSPVSKPSGLMKMKPPRPQSVMRTTLQSKDIRGYHSGRESQISAAQQETMVTRSSQSASLRTPYL